ncbi:hypothetical protein [uncultured Prevotella sp.]|uniref:hypothetical protein n=1 Tax=uncultured Prevotella sp. TaxID=159272 RepID=UPI00262AF191|nr:hypothetical protein [uncultured Prevotella sp.]
MKKIFTLAAVAVAAISANAQTESWYVNNSDGTLKAEYVANSDPNAMSVVTFSTENVEGTHTSGPIAGYVDGETTPLEAKVDNSWGGIQKKALSSDGSVAEFYYVQGKGNPVNIDKVTWEEIVTDDVPTGVYRAYWNDAYYNPDGTAGLPTNGTYVTLTPKAEGQLKVAVWINKGNRDVYVVKKSDAKALALGTDVVISGYVNGTNWDVEEESPLKGYPMYQESIATKGTEGTDAYVIGGGNQACWVYLTFTAAANETYYVFNKNTQIGFGGFEFTSGSTGISEITTTVDNANAPVYNLAGQRVSKDAKGILIQNGKKFIRK